MEIDARSNQLAHQIAATGKFPASEIRGGSLFYRCDALGLAEDRMTSVRKEETSLRREAVLGNEVLSELLKVRQKLIGSFKEELRHQGVTLARARALLALSKEGDLTQTSVAAYLEIEGPSAVRLIDELEKSGLVLRQQDANDRRIKNLILTDEGKEMSRLLLEKWQEICDKTVLNIEVDDQRSLLSNMKAMLVNLNR
ncbi:MAG: MarR family transcriptional regulator [Chelatococcus sp.]|jgi:MarR family transcriptional regulator for hemolysin|uniref:MarR family winged helix-turn-helix transcriptional regulator n=1 Tax=unclassified Chelatococcus TaxID=2638111 RepID=UPI001BD111F8|nr:MULTISPECIES: MarR family transcriptional regulator [unclassified Chelatococcus]MBS7739875.1 MarR family transcriptional regulator [Chelatococcus sp. HY11]MBX3536571.1 MarR family transcriptional regulator [Chelatococcus sp.]MBX3545519.1 MarR family transcriptional regulator [Chelatococcus sp.]MCO5078826.1 MarR family transcriptional regulator [Chelatococcus sp.]